MMDNITDYIKKHVQSAVAEQKEYGEWKDQVANLPEKYQAVLNLLANYYELMASSSSMDVLNNMLTIFQEAVKNEIPVENLVGNDPVKFVDNVMARFKNETWIDGINKKFNDQYNEIINK